MAPPGPFSWPTAKPAGAKAKPKALFLGLRGSTTDADENAKRFLAVSQELGRVEEQIRGGIFVSAGPAVPSIETLNRIGDLIFAVREGRSTEVDRPAELLRDVLLQIAPYTGKLAFEAHRIADGHSQIVADLTRAWQTLYNRKTLERIEIWNDGIRAQRKALEGFDQGFAAAIAGAVQKAAEKAADAAPPILSGIAVNLALLLVLGVVLAFSLKG